MNTLTSTRIKKSENVLTYFIAIIIGAFPVLSIYASPLRGVSVGDWCLLICLIVVLCSAYKNILITGTLRQLPASPVVWYFVLITLQSFLMYIFFVFSSVDLSSPITRMIRYLFYLLFVVVMTQGFTEKKVLLNIVVFISLLSTAWVFIQQIMYSVFSVPLPGYITCFPTFHSEHTFEETVAFLKISQRYRPSGIFLESSHHAEYAILGLIVLLMHYKNKKAFTGALFITVGLIVSTSTLGMVLAAIVWIIWFFKIAPISSSSKLVIGVLFIGALICLIPLALSIEQVSEALYKLNRYFGSGSVGFFSGARMESYAAVFSLDIIYQFFGEGFGMMPNGEPYMTSAAYIWYGLGLIGLLYTLAFIVILLIGTKQPYAKTIAFVTLVCFFVTELFVSFWIVLYLFLIIGDPKHASMSGGEKGETKKIRL